MHWRVAIGCIAEKPQEYNLIVGGCSSVVEHELPKLGTGVRFPSPALLVISDQLSAERIRVAPINGEPG